MKQKILEILDNHSGLAQINGKHTAALWDKLYDGVADEILALSRWISVEDEMPEVGIQVLTIDTDGWYMVIYYNGKWHAEVDVTHWQPLPESPEVE